MNDLEEKKELLKDCLFNFEYSQVEIPETKLVSDGYKKIPIGELSGIGIAASSLASVFNNVTTTVINNGGETLLKPANVNVSELYKTGEGLVRGFAHDGSRFTKNGLFEVVQGGESVVKTTIAYNPAMLFVAGAIASISNNLETIKDNQNKMLLHFEAEEKAELQGDLNVLLEELDKYKYYYNEDRLKLENLGITKHIKKDATRKIAYYQSVLENDLIQKSLIRFNRDIIKTMQEVLRNFRYYQLAVYEYAFSSFLEIMLAEFFDEGYLDETIRLIDNYHIKYRTMYSDYYDIINNFVKGSVESIALKGIGKAEILAGKVTGKAIEKLQLSDKLKLDDRLVDIGEKMEKTGENFSKELLEKYTELKECGVRHFVENIKTVSMLYNKPMDVLIGKDSFYYKLNG